MTLAEMQPIAQAILSKSEKTGAFPSDLVEDGVTDLVQEVDDRTQKYGACFLIGAITSAHAENSAFPVQAQATMPVFVYEQPAVDHSPAGVALIDAVVSALTERKSFNFLGFAKFTNEKGGTLTVCEFTSLIVFNS